MALVACKFAAVLSQLFLYHVAQRLSITQDRDHGTRGPAVSADLPRVTWSSLTEQAKRRQPSFYDCRSFTWQSTNLNDSWTLKTEIQGVGSPTTSTLALMAEVVIKNLLLDKQEQ
jgi:hypothetical protein